MRDRRTKKKVGVAFATALGALTVASNAWACVTYLGDLTAFNNSGSQTVTGAGGLSGFAHGDWCNGDPGAVLSEFGGVANFVSLSVAPGTCNNVSDQLPAGTYYVDHAAGYMGQGGLPHINCHSRLATRIGTMIVSAAGTGAGSYAYTSAPAGVGTNLCVYAKKTYSYGNSINIATI